jgi:hypothetical protein
LSLEGEYFGEGKERESLVGMSIAKS